MSFTSNYIDGIYSQTLDLKNFYSKENTFKDDVFGTLETFGKYVTVTFGHCITFSELALIPFVFALDIIKLSGNILASIFNCEINYSIATFLGGLAILGFGGASIYLGFIADYEYVYRISFDLLRNANPNFDTTHPLFLQAVTNHTPLIRLSGSYFGILFTISGVTLLINSIINDDLDNPVPFILGHMTIQLTKITKIALAVLCPTLVYSFS
jgi:hypothetical protein